MWAKLEPVWVVMRREMRDLFRDWRIIIPVVVLTLFFPTLMNFTARQVLNFVEQYGANIIATRFIPFLLMIVGFFPITVSLVIALESFAGETERRSIEPLLGSPLADWQLYLGKLLASLLPPLAASYLGVIVYLVGIYRTTDWRPPVMFMVLIACLNAVQALVMVSGAVVVSTQTTSVRAANLLSSFIVVPMALLIQGESVMMLWADYHVLWWAVLGEAIVAGLLVRMGVTHFNREELLGREIDTLNLRWAWTVFRRAFVGEARNIGEWYRLEIPRSLKRLKIPILCTALLLAFALWAGLTHVSMVGATPEMLNLNAATDLNSELLDQFRQIGFFSVGSVLYIWLHNLRVVAIAVVAGAISFSVLGVLILMIPMALIGFLTALAGMAGNNPATFMAAFILPHGLFEIPAMILSGAAILKIGATLVTPAKDETIGKAWLSALADWLRITLALVVPLFLGAALLEVFFTPRFAVWFLGGG